MQLWTDYEGVTIDGAFPLHKLLLPEGRSAFFSTAGPNGEPTLVRLIECHFDEQEILARWRCVEALNHPHFLKFEHYGQIELDGGSVVYAVVETVDANLASVLDQGHLSVEDVADLASSLVAALDVLHIHGFIHEHVEPRNIFAVGEVVKLRSDCIREAPEGEEGRAAKQRDVRDVATVLLQALTQRQSLEGVSDSALPAPFAQIIRNGLEGRWGLVEIRAALEGRFGSRSRIVSKNSNGASAANSSNGATPPKFSNGSAAAKSSNGAAAAQSSNGASPSKTTNGATAPTSVHAAAATPAATGEKAATTEKAARPVKPSIWTESQFSFPLADQGPLFRKDPFADENEKAEFAGAATRKDAWGRKVPWRRRDAATANGAASAKDAAIPQDNWARKNSWSINPRFLPSRRQLGAAGVVAVLALLFTSLLAHEWNAHRDHVQPATVSQSYGTPIPAGSARHSIAAASPRAGVPGSRADWRVIAFTYTHKADAQKKVSSLAGSHPDLHPAVFAPSGHAPYLVSIGGLMNRDTAYALARRVRSLGLPRDTYAQNYSH